MDKQLRSLFEYTHLTPHELSQSRQSADLCDCSIVGWRAWSLTQVLYRNHDVISYFFALSSFLPIVIILFLCGLASAPSPRRVPSLVLLLGLVLNVALNVTLKSLLLSPRPAHPGLATGIVSYSTSHGMPSDHAQFMSFFVFYLARGSAAVTAASGGKRVAVTTSPSFGMRLIFAAALSIVAAGRVYNSYHTVGQVVVGMAVGAVTAFVWSRALVQAYAARVCEGLIVPIMLWCTAWTARV